MDRWMGVSVRTFKKNLKTFLCIRVKVSVATLTLSLRDVLDHSRNHMIRYIPFPIRALLELTRI